MGCYGHQRAPCAYSVPSAGGGRASSAPRSAGGAALRAPAPEPVLARDAEEIAGVAVAVLAGLAGRHARLSLVGWRRRAGGTGRWNAVPHVSVGARGAGAGRAGAQDAAREKAGGIGRVAGGADMRHAGRKIDAELQLRARCRRPHPTLTGARPPIAAAPSHVVAVGALEAVPARVGRQRWLRWTSGNDPGVRAGRACHAARATGTAGASVAAGPAASRVAARSTRAAARGSGLARSPAAGVLGARELFSTARADRRRADRDEREQTPHAVIIRHRATAASRRRAVVFRAFGRGPRLPAGAEHPIVGEPAGGVARRDPTR